MMRRCMRFDRSVMMTNEGIITWRFCRRSGHAAPNTLSL